MLTGYAKAGTTIGTPAGQFVEPKDVMSAAVGVRSTRAIAAESAGGSSARICSGQIEVRAFPTAVIAPAKVAPARLVKGRGRKLLVAPADAPPMTTEAVKAILADFP